MTDQFLIKFALVTFGFLSFALQHSAQLLYRRISKEIPRDKNVTYIFGIIIMQLVSAAIIIEMMNYALKK